MSCHSCKSGGAVVTNFLYVPVKRTTNGHTKGTRSITHPGDLDYTTKRGDKVFHRRGHNVKRKRKPFSRIGGTYDPHYDLETHPSKGWGERATGIAPMSAGASQALVSVAKQLGPQLAKDLLKAAAITGGPLIARKIYKKIKHRK